MTREGGKKKQRMMRIVDKKVRKKGGKNPEYTSLFLKLVKRREEC